MTLLRDLIHIPEQVHKGDFVLKLTDGVRDPKATLGNYVFTPQLLTAFDQALKLVKGGLEGNQSRAAFLHGSFGSGKSHFMAVLHLLLAHEPTARSHPELASLVAKHRWLDGRKFLLVPFHMIGASSLEERLFGQYVSHVGALHPTAPVPPVFHGEAVLRQAEAERVKNEAAFLAKLGSGGDGWGKLSTWTRERYDAARQAAPNSPDRLLLISAVVTHYLPAYEGVMGGRSEGYVSLDDGLPILCQHAKNLGYDVLVFFLDEVILWLATMVADLGFVQREGSKLAKLVESQGAPRAIPLVSLLARQRDLRELVGEHVPGAEKLGVFDIFKWWEGRFDAIKLEDRNLPMIVAKRLLAPSSETGKQQLDAAFAATHKVRREIFDALLTQSFTEDDFRRVYPFSPALIQTLVAVSSVLQRERTAIRVLVQLLVDQRDTLEVGQLVPMGDLFDAIADGDEPFSPDMRLNFENAKKLYEHKLLPRLLADHQLTREQARSLPADDPKRRALRADDRIVKTLLLSALVPEVESLKALTAGRLVALNHGTIKAPIPGQETSIVLRKLRDWNGDVGEIRIQGEGANPTISLQIIGVDTEGILAKVRSAVDNTGTRKAKIKEILFDAMGIAQEDELFTVHTFRWRGTPREIEVVYGNVRELPAESLRVRREGAWRLVIDYPFDDGHTPDEDLQRLDLFRQTETSRTVCWIPAFLSSARIADLGTLVCLDYVLANDQRFHDHATHLPPVERSQARALLQSQQSQMRDRIVEALKMAYGIADAGAGMIGADLDVAERFQCLEGRQQLFKRPAAATLGQALEKLGDQMFELQFPDHPQFNVDIKGGLLKRVLEWVQQAARDEMHRVVVDKERRREVREVVEPLKLGTMGEDALVLSDTWRTLFERYAAQQKDEPITVARLRSWTDRPNPRGLPRDVQNFLILAYAEQTNRRFFHHGGGVSVSLDRVDDELELRDQPLPSEAHWQEARTRADHVFGVHVTSLLGATNVGELIGLVRAGLAAHLPACRQLTKELHARLKAEGIAPDSAARWRTAQAVVVLGDALEQAKDDLFVERLATATAPSPWNVVGTSLKQVEAVRQALRETRWDVLETAWSLPAPHADAAGALRQRLREVLAHDDQAQALPPALRAIEAEANALTRKAVAGGLPTPPPGPPAPPPPPVQPGRKVVASDERQDLSASDVRALLDTIAKQLEGGRRRAVIQWRIEEEDARG